MTTSHRLAIAGAIGLLLAWATWTWGTPPERGQEERAAIAQMPQGQRDQLRRRYQEFQSLSAAQRAAILELHQAVMRDPELAETLAAYSRFVTRLDPWEREALENESDPDQRLAHVRQLINAGDDRHGDMRRPGWMTGEMVRGSIYRADDFQEILSGLVAMLPGSHAIRGTEDSVEWQLRAFKSIRAQLEARDYRDWPSLETTNEFLAMIPGEWIHKILEHSRRKDDRDGWRHRKLLKLLLARTLMAQWQRAVSRRIPADEIQTIVSSVDPREHRDWPWRDPGKLQAAIMRKFEDKPGDIGEFARRYREVRELYLKIDPWADDHDHDDHHRGNRRRDDRHQDDRRSGDHDKDRHQGPRDDHRDREDRDR